MTPFGTRLRAATSARGRLCVGIDPHPALLAAWGLRDDPAGLERFTMTAVDALGPHVAAVKPQSAFFERHGSRGTAVLERAIAAARAAGALVVLDVKRGDIGSTMEAYADAYLDPASPLAADAVTVSPFLGLGSLEPAFTRASKHGGGIFVLALTSNPEGPEVQHARVGAGGTVAGTVLEGLRRRNAADFGDEPVGSYGAVVGATIGGTEEDLAIGGPLLVPGIGVQGGSADSVRALLGGDLADVLPSVSREVLGAGPDPAALRDAAARAAAAFAGW